MNRKIKNIKTGKIFTILSRSFSNSEIIYEVVGSDGLVISVTEAEINKNYSVIEEYDYSSSAHNKLM